MNAFVLLVILAVFGSLVVDLYRAWSFYKDTRDKGAVSYTFWRAIKYKFSRYRTVRPIPPCLIHSMDAESVAKTIKSIWDTTNGLAINHDVWYNKYHRDWTIYRRDGRHYYQNPYYGGDRSAWKSQ